MLFWLPIYITVAIVASIVSFLLYGFDKRQARLKRWRVRERTLHFWSVAGGWPGAIAGQRVFRHKTFKVTYRAIFWLTVVVHLSILVVGVVLWLR